MAVKASGKDVETTFSKPGQSWKNVLGELLGAAVAELYSRLIAQRPSRIQNLLVVTKERKFPIEQGEITNIIHLYERTPNN
jgi:hypothetical protein